MRNGLIGMSVRCTVWLVASTQQATTPKAQPSLVPQEKATNPMPSSNAQGKTKTQKTSVGKGKLTVTTQQPVDFWQEQVAYSGGSMVITDFLYDSNLGVLYLS